MKSLILSFGIVGILGFIGGGRAAQPGFDLPALHEIRTVTLSPPYSCKATAQSANGYGESALFLSNYARRRNGPDLLFNGTCSGTGYFEAATAGDDMSLVADLGAGLTLNELSASRAFNVRRVHEDGAYSRFAQSVRIQAGHTYAVLLNTSDKRGLILVSVADYAPGEKVTLNYAVKSYQVVPNGQILSPGFDWGRGSK